MSKYREKKESEEDECYKLNQPDYPNSKVRFNGVKFLKRLKKLKSNGIILKIVKYYGKLAKEDKYKMKKERAFLRSKSENLKRKKEENENAIEEQCTHFLYKNHKRMLKEWERDQLDKTLKKLKVEESLLDNELIELQKIYSES